MLLDVQHLSEMQKYKISGCVLGISNLYLEKVWNLFRCSVSEKVDVIIEKSISVFSYYENLEMFLGNYEDKYYIVRINQTDLMQVNKNWTHCKIFPLNQNQNLYNFLIQVFYTHAVKQHMIHMHSSLIEYKKTGIMFLGPSGIGKTTQAELWSRYRKALIVNGDMVFVQETDDGFLSWGTPWHGSSPYCENTSVPLKAMIVLKQAPENSIRELTGFEKVTEVSNSVFYPQWLENGMKLCLETLDHLLTRIPVYELSCRPDEDAVRLAEEAVFGSCG